MGSVQRQTDARDADDFPVRVPATWDEADALAGHRVDRRFNYLIDSTSGRDQGGLLLYAVYWTQHCTGCSFGFEERGSGCHECGHHGVERCGQFVPYSRKEQRGELD